MAKARKKPEPEPEEEGSGIGKKLAIMVLLWAFGWQSGAVYEARIVKYDWLERQRGAIINVPALETAIGNLTSESKEGVRMAMEAAQNALDGALEERTAEDVSDEEICGGPVD